VSRPKKKAKLQGVCLGMIPCLTGDIALEYDAEMFDEPGVRVYQPGSPAPDMAWIPEGVFLAAANKMREGRS
jgi:hypothetical protein